MIANWTDEQKKAILSDNANLLVSAGAGAGKTAVLVHRIIRKILDKESNIDIDRLLVVTYTNAAASEMKERIGDEIQKRLEKNFQPKRLQRQLTLLNQSNIMTMHSFCLKVIRDNFQLVDLDPNFRVADNEESILLKQNSISELFEEKYNSNDNQFLLFVDSYGDKDDSVVKNIVIDLYEFLQSIPWPKRWLNQAVEEFNLDTNFKFENSKFANLIIINLHRKIKKFIDKLKSAVKIMHMDTGLETYENSFLNDILNLQDIIKINSWQKMVNALKNIKFERLNSLKNKNYNEEIKQKIVKIRNDVKKSLKQVRENIFGYTENINESIKIMYPMMKCLMNIVNEFYNKYSLKKRDRNIVDFNDIEHFCLDILTYVDDKKRVVPSNTAIYYRNFFDEILVDEYQDSNAVQEVIINMISKKDECSNVFMVGDVKQSIYRFRQAKPELFLKKYNSYSDKDDSKNRRIKLFKNFRSRFQIIKSVNYIFRQIMCKEVGELDYDENEELQAGAEYPYSEIKGTFENDCIEVNIIDKSSSEKNEENLDDVQVEARLIARRIEELVNHKNDECRNIYDRNINSYRPVMYKDIVVLMRATKNWAPILVDEFNNFGIPVFADTSTGYFETVEINTIMSLLKIIDNPVQDIPLIAVLRSPIESFSPEELIDIRIVNKNVHFYEALKNCINDSGRDYSTDHIEDGLRNKVNNFLIQLDKWRKKVVHMSIDEFLWYLYMDTGYYGFVGAMPGGTQRQANLRMLFQKAEQYEKSSYKGLFNFINFVDKLKSSSGDMGSARILGENENVVRIMSIHKSKGLEFPIVIIAGAGKNFNFTDMNKPILFNEELGFGPDYVDSKKRIKHPTIMKQILKGKLKIETLSEEMRILYVAFTRAKEKLIITGMVNNVVKTCRRWCEESIVDEKKVPEYALIDAKNFLDWIGEALARHRDGEIIRKIASHDYKIDTNLIVDDPSKWNIKLWKKENFFKRLEKNSKNNIVWKIKNNLLKQGKSRHCDEIIRRLNWKYKYYDVSKIPAKFSVSELKRKFETVDAQNSMILERGQDLKKPQFIEGKSSISSAEKGTLVHLVMQHIDLKNIDSKMSIKRQIQNLVNKQFITEKESKVISEHKIFNFFTSQLGTRMRKCKKVYREVPFYMQIDSRDVCDELDEYTGKGEKVIIQGIIDCYFQEKEEIVLIDYKTDYVDNFENIKKKYRVQIEYYSMAIEKMTGIKVKERYLYLFQRNVALKI